MFSQITRGIQVVAEPQYIPEKSNPENNEYVFAYRIRLHNQGAETVQLIARHWIIHDSTGDVREVKGLGVIGRQPVLPPDGQFEYMSGSHLHSPVGTMHGTYLMVTEEGETFQIDIPMFRLSAGQELN